MIRDHLLDSGALRILNKILGATGGDQHTHIDSSNLQLSLNANEIVRRGRTLAGSEGLWAAGIVNTHAAADDQTTQVDPYAVAGSNGWQNPIPEGFDLWIVSPCVTLNADVAGSAFLGLQWSATQVAFGVATHSEPLLIISGSALIGGTRFGTPTIAAPVTGRAYRIARGAKIRFDSTATGAGAMTARFLLGVFPAALGQDAVA